MGGREKWIYPLYVRGFCSGVDTKIASMIRNRKKKKKVREDWGFVVPSNPVYVLCTTLSPVKP